MDYFKVFLLLCCWTNLNFCNHVKLIKSNISCENRGLKTVYCQVLPKVLRSGVKEVQSQYTYLGDGSIDSETFQDASWKQVQVLKIKDNEYLNKSNAHSIIRIKSHGLDGLKNIQELYINSLYLKIIEKDIFKGLHSLRILNFDRCPHLSFDQDTLPALIEANELQDLHELSLRRIDTFTEEEGFSLNISLFNATVFKRIERLLVGENTIHHLELTPLQNENACDYLREIDLSNSKIQKMSNLFLWKPICKNITLFNLRFASLPDRIIRIFDNECMPKEVSVNSSNILKFIYSIQAIDLTGIFPDEDINFLRNGTILNLSIPTDWKLKKVHVGRNHLKAVNLTIRCEGVLIEELNMTNNYIEFIHPNSISCLTGMKLIDLSHNRLGEMESKYPDLFKLLLLTFHALTYVDLKHNYLKDIPTQMFQENTILEVLDLSYNELKSISFDISQLQNIKTLNLRRNRIILLDDNFIRSFESLFVRRKNRSEIINSLVLSENSFSCSNCKSFETINWIVESPAVDTKKQGILCTNDVNDIVDIDDKVVAAVNDICEKPDRIRTIAISVTVTPLVCLSIFLCIMYVRWKCIGMGTLDETIRLIEDNHENDRFFVFFAYSSDDDDFAKYHVCGPLKDNLKKKINMENLICDGDAYFRLGKLIINEMHSNLNRSSVVLVLVSRAFCRSAHCRNELQFAHNMNKPIILMFKEHVPENDMTPVMRVLFNRYARVTWKMKNGEPKLSTSWEHLCHSLIMLADNEDGKLLHKTFKSYLFSSILHCFRKMKCQNNYI